MLVAQAGTRYIFVGRLFERRPSYHLLGVLLFLQLGISAGSWALANLTQQLSGAAAAAAAGDLSLSPLERSNPDVGAHTRKALRAAVVWRVRAKPCNMYLSKAWFELLWYRGHVGMLWHTQGAATLGRTP